MFIRYLGLLFCIVAVFSNCSVYAQTLAQLRLRAGIIEGEIAQIRERSFKQSINVGIQSTSELEAYLERQSALQNSGLDWAYYDRVIRKLGLYRGNFTLDRSGFISFSKSQVAAYYDPDVDKFYLIMQNLPTDLLDGLLAHELCHGLQDQYFDLNQFLFAQVNTLSADEMLARQAVVEGEATYIQTVWTLKNLIGQIPEDELLQNVIDIQTQLDVEKLREQMKKVVSLQSNEQAAIEAIDALPDFMILQQIGVYQLGMNFVYQIQKQGWENIDRLYTQPPVSTEQILHPAKWLSDETPNQLNWPPFQQEAIFNEWEMLDKNTLGELMWRIIFSEFDMDNRGNVAAAGWNGDRYAIFRTRDGNALLLMIYTSWDTEGDAEEFSQLYDELLALKYSSRDITSAISRRGRDVLILESDINVDTDAILTFMGTTRTWEQAVIRAVDFNENGQVDFEDFLLFVQNFGKDQTTIGFNPIFDLNQDGQINFSDFLTFAQHFGKSTS